MNTIFGVAGLYVLLAFAGAAAACTSNTSAGCTKDADCATGRVCGQDERCVDRDVGDHTAPAASASSAAPATGSDPDASLVSRCDARFVCTSTSPSTGAAEQEVGALNRVNGACCFTMGSYTPGPSTFVLTPSGGVAGGDATWSTNGDEFIFDISGDTLDCR